MNRRHFVTALAAPALPASAGAAAPPKHAPVSAKVPLQAELFPLREIRLTDGPLARQQSQNVRYLLKLEPDRLLSWFRREAGLEPKAPPYRGWESEGNALAGHILAFYMSGLGMSFQATGEEALKERMLYIAGELAAVQAAHGSGYCLAVPGGKRLFGEVAAGQFKITNAEPKYGFQINQVFEPTYTWNKITLGLYEMYLATGDETALGVLVRTADWFGHDVLDHLSDAQVQELLFCEHGSIHESMLNVYRLTGRPEYLKWARRLCFERMIEPMAAGSKEFLDGYHANCSIPIYTGFERVSQWSGEARLHEAARGFLAEVAARRTWVIGGNSAREHFYPPTEFERALHEPAGPETCNSVNMLRLIEALHCSDPRNAMVDLYERILWNHLLSAHEPERHGVAYYTPMQPGTYRVYSDEFDSMWCCVGTGLESPGKYGQMIYTGVPGQRVVDVNLYVASEFHSESLHFGLRQSTRFPFEARTSLTVTKADRRAVKVRVRHPAWVAGGGMKVRVNGVETGRATAPGEYAVVERVWRVGDRVEVELPMRLWLERLPNSGNYAALLYGPIVLSGALGREGLGKLDFWQITTTVPKHVMDEKRVPVLRGASVEDVLKRIECVDAGKLEFRLPGEGGGVRLVPFFGNHFQRYAIYWRTEIGGA